MPAFHNNNLSLVSLAKRYAPNTTIITNGSLHKTDRVQQLLNEGADIIALGKSALSNADFPNKLKAGQPINPFNTDMLGPVANLKDCKLSLEK